MTSDDILHDHMIPCLVEFATSCNDDQWKTLNQQLLIHSKDDDPKVAVFVPPTPCWGAHVLSLV